MSIVNPNAERGTSATTPAAHDYGFWHELRFIYSRAREVWGMIGPREHRLFLLSLVLMLITSLSYNALPLLLGHLVNAVQAAHDRGTLAADWKHLALVNLSIIGLVSLVREVLQAARRFAVSRRRASNAG